MSITRHLLNEFRPLFRMLEEPIGGRSGAFGIPSRAIFDDPFFTGPRLARPAVDVSEDGSNYIVETELPGVKKEDVQVHIGDGGRSVTIEGNIVRRGTSANGEGSTTSTSTAAAGAQGVEGTVGGHACCKSQERRVTDVQMTGSTVVQPSAAENNQLLSAERSFTGSSKFTRTVWLPRPADARNVTAKLADGILTLRIAKAEEKDAVKVEVE
jgi:HSP20 family molecular chaperone IbpA